MAEPCPAGRGDFGDLPARWRCSVGPKGTPTGGWSRSTTAATAKVEAAAPGPAPQPDGVVLLPTIPPDGSVHLGALNLGGIARGARLGVVADGTDGLYLRVTGDGLTFEPWRKIPG